MSALSFWIYLDLVCFLRILKQLKNGFNKPHFETKYPYKLEKMLHRHYQDKHILNEWFYLDKFDVEKFNETCEKYNNILLSLKDNPFFK